MKASTALIAAAVAVAAVAGVPVAGLAATGGPAVADQHENSTENASVAPGERLSGVVGVQEAELEGEVDGRAFGLQVARAATDGARADVVAEQFDDIEGRLAGLEERKRALDEARENGSMSEGKYRAEVTELAARTETVTELTNRSEGAAQGLPADLLGSKGINVTAIQTLKERAANMTGPEVAEIARSIAGPGAAPVDAGPDERPGQQGPPEERPGQGDGDAGAPTPTPDDGDEQQDGAGSAGDSSDAPTATPASDERGSQSGDRGDNSGAGGSN